MHRFDKMLVFETISFPHWSFRWELDLLPRCLKMLKA